MSLVNGSGRLQLQETQQAAGNIFSGIILTTLGRCAQANGCYIGLANPEQWSQRVSLFRV